MKKLSLYMSVAAFACSASTCSVQAVDMFLEGKAAYYRPTDHKFREIYSNRGLYTAEYSCQAWHGLYGWTSASYYASWGTSLGLKYRTHIYFVPLALGLKYLKSFKHVDFYLGAGAVGTYMNIKDHSHFVIPTVSKWGVGGIAKTGILVKLPKSFFFDFFTDYTYMKIDFHDTDHHRVQRHPANLSGWSIGGGIGYRFGGKTRSKRESSSEKPAEVHIKGYWL